MSEKINRIVIETGGKEYEFTGGGGGSLGPNTVDSEAIINDSVEMEDLNQSVRDKIQKTYVEGDESLHMDYDVAISTQESGHSSPIIVEEEEEP